MLLLNVGSGQRPFDKPWVNVDTQEKWGPDVLADGACMPMFEDNSAETIVLHQVYEHFGLGEADNLVRECYRILRPGGSLIVTTPNLKELVAAWIRGKIDTYIFTVNLYGAYMGHEADRHKWIYDAYGLETALATAAPWEVVCAFDFRILEGANIANDWWILGMEATK